MHDRLYTYWPYKERTREYKFRFNGGYITVKAKNEEEAKILAQAEAIKNGWNHEILPTMSIEELKELIGNKVDEIFDAYNGTCKNLEALDKVNLDTIQNMLTEFIVRV